MNERQEQLAKAFYAHVFEALDNEPDIDGMEAGRIATVAEKAFLSALSPLGAASIRDDLAKLMAEGVDFDDILVNDGCSEWGVDCACTRQQAEELLDGWEKYGADREEALSQLIPADEWILDNPPDNVDELTDDFKKLLSHK